jgi:hypothetical protein
MKSLFDDEPDLSSIYILKWRRLRNALGMSEEERKRKKSATVANHAVARLTCQLLLVARNFQPQFYGSASPVVGQMAQTEKHAVAVALENLGQERRGQIEILQADADLDHPRADRLKESPLDLPLRRARC